MVYYKIMRRIFHSLQKFFAFIDNNGAVAPCKYGCEKGGNFNILLFSKTMGDRDGIWRNKIDCIICFHFTIQEMRQAVIHKTKLRMREKNKL